MTHTNMRRPATIAGFVAAATFLMHAQPADAVVEYYLKIPNIEGEATDKDHKDWIDILSISHAGRLHMPSDTVSAAASTDDGRGKGGDPDRAVITGSVANLPAAAQHNQSDLEFILERAERSSPQLQQACTGGRSLGRVELHRVTDGRLHMSYTLYGARCAAMHSPDQHVMSAAKNGPAKSADDGTARAMPPRGKARSMAEGGMNTHTHKPMMARTAMRLTYDCAEWTDHMSGRSGPECPAATKARPDIMMKGHKIKEN